MTAYNGFKERLRNFEGIEDIYDNVPQTDEDDVN